MPNKQLGQHWLKDASMLESIAGYLNLRPEDFVLEIGPGLGTLTARLLKTGAKVLAVEFDPGLAKNLPASFPGKKNLQVLNQDIRRFNFEDLPKGYKLATNLPYYISGVFFRILTTTKNKPQKASILVQKEVASKICQVPGSGQGKGSGKWQDEGQSNKLAMLVTYYYQPSLGIEVPSRFFSPPPKVDSQVLVLSLRAQPLFNVDFEYYSWLVRIAFAAPRKTLLNNLAAGLRLSKADATDLLGPLKLNLEKARAEHLSLEDWQGILNLTLKP